MTALTEFLNLARDPLPEGAEARAAANAAIESALDRIEPMRRRIEGEIEAIAGKRRDLLLDDRAEARRKLAELDKAAEGLTLDLERLDAVEEQLAGRLHAFDRATRADAAAALVADYERAIEFWAETMGLAVGARRALIMLRERAVAEGLECRLGSFELPHTTFPTDLPAIEAFRRGAIGAARQMTLPGAAAETYPIRFVQPHAPYHAGMTAGFPAEQAWAFVEHGVAVFADPRRRPPKTATKKDLPR